MIKMLQLQPKGLHKVTQQLEMWAGEAFFTHRKHAAMALICLTLHEPIKYLSKAAFFLVLPVIQYLHFHTERH